MTVRTLRRTAAPHLAFGEQQAGHQLWPRRRHHGRRQIFAIGILKGSLQPQVGLAAWLPNDAGLISTKRWPRNRWMLSTSAASRAAVPQPCCGPIWPRGATAASIAGGLRRTSPIRQRSRLHPESEFAMTTLLSVASP